MKPHRRLASAPVPTTRGRGQRAAAHACVDCGKPLGPTTEGRHNRCRSCGQRARRGLPPSPGRDHLLVACWCRTHYDYVHVDVTRAGSTWTCWLPECEEASRG